ncbi:MAG: lipocalin-like domain-containing protein [Gemmatimonadota bacterium]
MRTCGRLRTALPVAATLVLVSCGAPDASPNARSRLSLVETLAGADTVGYSRAFEPRTFDFPADHGPHPDFRTEWWYVTGNLESEAGRDFGFQFTIFRNALAPDASASPSAWSTRQAYMGHFTVTDVQDGRFHAFERFARGAAGLAGAEAPPLRVWLEDWALEAEGATTFPLRLRAEEDDVALSLELSRGKPAVQQGDRGLSQKGPEPGNASYYYSQTRMPASGTLVVEADTFAVRGSAWLDREWSTSALSDGQVGWDWFALQLDDGWDLMVYRLRRADGSADPLSDGVLVDPEGRRVALGWGTDITMESTGTWTSPLDGAVYPSGWRIAVPARGWDLRVEPRIRDQELDVSFRYWEGAVSVDGVGEGGRSVDGRGYVELTGYAGGGRE